MKAWKEARAGWVGERNFVIEIAEETEGFYFRVKVLGFAAMEEPQTSYPTQPLAEAGALRMVAEQFEGEVDVSD
jgi:hypothetical protein